MISQTLLIVYNKILTRDVLFLTDYLLEIFISFNAVELSHSLEKKSHLRWLNYADNTFLPLARRRANTLRPPTDFMRDLNPWTFWCFLLLGWYVLFTKATSYLFVYTNLSNCFMIIADSPYKVKPNLYFYITAKTLIHNASTTTIRCGNYNVYFVTIYYKLRVLKEYFSPLRSG